ncbi:MAG: hypothetical protein ABR920_06995 [Terriglobales bacterium]
MPSYPLSIRRCQHLKVNGTQCGSPALRDEKYCYYHVRWTPKGMEAISHLQKEGAVMLPTLEDANSIQVALADVIRMLRTQEVDHRTAALMLYALQTASANLKHTSFEPEPTQVVIDRECVERRPLGATAWSTVEGREYDEVEKDDTEKNDDAEMRSAALRLVLEKFGPDWIDMVEGREAGEAEELVEG